MRINQLGVVLALAFISHSQLAAVAIGQDHVWQGPCGEHPVTRRFAGRSPLHRREDVDFAIAHGVRSTGADEHHTTGGADLDVCELGAIEVVGQLGEDLGTDNVVPVNYVQHALFGDRVGIPETIGTRPSSRTHTAW